MSPIPMPKNIVLLCDDLDSISQRPPDTNIWRMYESLDRRNPTEQVVFYDEGTNTSFKPLALLGAACGFDLKHNVLRLYRFLCDVYEPGDRIYAFGFGSGATAIRVFVALVSSQGIIRTRATVLAPAAHAHVGVATAASIDFGEGTDAPPVRLAGGRQTARFIRWAYRAFRREEFVRRSWVVRLVQYFGDVLLRSWERDAHRYDRKNNHQIAEVTFVGLWDSVNPSRVLSVGEVSRYVDTWVWPLSAFDRRLPAKVAKACHAVAVDEERSSFHPVLWDESDERQDASHLDEERVSQVWFAGSHGNVGGGHRDDGLAYISLDWIATEAAKRGLRFARDLLDQHTGKADPFGRLNDSASGVSGFIDYGPRRIDWLLGGANQEPSRQLHVAQGTTARPKIHESVFVRIAAATGGYAPIVFPSRYGIVRQTGLISDGVANLFESRDAADARVRAQESVWTLIWWRRAAYFASVLCVFIVFGLPAYNSNVREVTEAERTLASRAVELGGQILPEALKALGIPMLPNAAAAFTEPLVEYYSSRPTALMFLFVAFTALVEISRRLQIEIRARMREIWSEVIPGFARDRDLTRLGRPLDLLSRVRSDPRYQRTSAVLRRFLLPTLLRTSTSIVLASCLIGALNRGIFEITNVVGAMCTHSGVLRPLVTGEYLSRLVSSHVFCTSSGILIEEGARYRATFSLPADWADLGIRVASPEGFSYSSPGLGAVQRAVFFIYVPFRRIWSANWFVPIARIGERGFDQYPLGARDNTFTARNTGELFLFVNDSIAPIGPAGLGWTSYYPNNTGTATVTITRLR